MLELIKENYGFTDYQIAQLKYFFLTVFSELSKLFLIGLCFLDNVWLFIWTIVIFQIIRSSIGGLHCKTYWGCFFLSLSYMVLAIRILPLVPVSKLLQMVALLICIIIAYQIGPLTSVFHPVLSEDACQRLKNKVFMTIFIFLIALYILPENPYMTTGYWVIILNICQLVLAKILKKEGL